MSKIKVIAEIASAHQGDLNTLLSLINAAGEANACGVKFQWYKYDHIATSDYRYYECYKNLFFKEEQWEEALKLACKNNLDVWIEVFDDWGLDLAKKHINNIYGFKIPATMVQSSEIMNKVLAFNKPIILGVGGWNDDEINNLINMYDLNKRNDIVFIYGFQGYPTRVEDINLKRIRYLKEKFGFKIGFADHCDASKSLAIDIPIYAVFTGAELIEKHITLDRDKNGYDYFSALEPQEMKDMIVKLRDAELCMGKEKISKQERAYLKDATRVVAKRDIKTGEIVSIDKVINKRTSFDNALMPNEFYLNMPVLAKKTIKKNQPIVTKVLEKPSITICVVCRLKSTRLKKKALLPINGISSIERCLINCLATKYVNNVVLATSYLKEDDPLEKFTLEGKVKVIRGNPDNIVDRMLEVARETNANIILRVTGDTPLISPEILNILIKSHLESGKDLTLPNIRNFTIGTAGDVYTVQALEKLYKYGDKLTHTEYLSLYFLNNPDLFNVNQVDLPQRYVHKNWRLTLDELADLMLLDAIYKNLNVGREPLYFEKVIDYLLKNEKLTKINSKIKVKWKDIEKLRKEINNATILK